jgi:hypothetical protein
MSELKNCAAVRDQFALLLYGELSFDEEERVESHLDGCAECRQALEHQRALHDAVDGVAVTPSPALLSRCREDFSALLDREHPVPGMGAWWRRWWLPTTAGWNVQFLRPTAAVALLAVGFFAAKVTPGLNIFGVNQGNAYQAMGLANFGGAQVRNVSAQADGSVQIVLDETRQRMVSGNLDDQQIRVLLLAAAKDAADPGLRAQTVTLLTGGADAEDVRQALVFALANDQSADVRLKAMEGLKRFAGDPLVQSALARVLLSDSDSGIRTRAIDALTARPGQDLDRQTVGALQEMMDREDDAHVREQGQRMLRSIKASAEIY